MNYPVCVAARIYTPYATVQGLLSQIQTFERRKAGPLGPEPSAARLGPRALSTGVVDSLGEGMERGILWIK
jgi:hypothetical protein